jgi:hypothetical protein
MGHGEGGRCHLKVGDMKLYSHFQVSVQEVMEGKEHRTGCKGEWRLPITCCFQLLSRWNLALISSHTLFGRAMYLGGRDLHPAKADKAHHAMLPCQWLAE